MIEQIIKDLKQAEAAASTKIAAAQRQAETSIEEAQRKAGADYEELGKELEAGRVAALKREMKAVEREIAKIAAAGEESRQQLRATARSRKAKLTSAVSEILFPQ